MSKYLVFSERYLDGKILDARKMRLEVIIAKSKRQYITVVEVDTEMERELQAVIDTELY